MTGLAEENRRSALDSAENVRPLLGLEELAEEIENDLRAIKRTADDGGAEET